MDAAHIRAMQKGRLRAAAQKRRAGIRRVTAYKRWLRSGSDPRTIPEIPSDADYKAWREAQR